MAFLVGVVTGIAVGFPIAVGFEMILHTREAAILFGLSAGIFTTIVVSYLCFILGKLNK